MQVSLASAFNRRLLDSHSAAVWNQLWYVVLVEVNEENLASHRYVGRKGRHILISFSDNCGYFSLKLDEFLKG